MQSQRGNDTVKVAVRIRPRKDGEKEEVAFAEGNSVSISKIGNPLAFLDSQKSRTFEFTFDFAFSPWASQREVYEETTEPLVHNVISGINSTVFAYGASGAGKTHTMFGTEGDPGITDRVISDIFQLKSIQVENGINLEVKMSFIEIYCETVKDLLRESGSNSKKAVEINEDSEEVKIRNLSLLACSDLPAARNLLKLGLKNRQVESTKVNNQSSRSHAVLQICLEKRTRNGRKTNPYSKFSLIDLAGSERAGATENKGIRLKEAAHINKSLLALANCVNALACRHETDSKKVSTRVKYRDSKLTHLLKNSMEGQCRLVIIANVNPTAFEESHNTLTYANRAKSIKVQTQVVKDKTLETDFEALAATLAKLESENGTLRNECVKLREQVKEEGSKDFKSVNDEVLKNLESENARLKEQIDVLNTSLGKVHRSKPEGEAKSVLPVSLPEAVPAPEPVLLVEALNQMKELCGIMQSYVHPTCKTPSCETPTSSLRSQKRKRDESSSAEKKRQRGNQKKAGPKKKQAS